MAAGRTVHRLPEVWGATAAEQADSYPCDELAPQGQRLLRAVSSTAAPEGVYRWLCQLRVAPYSYDWVDNAGRTSPRHLVPGLDELAVGQRAMTIFEVASFAPGRDVTFVLRPGAPELVFGTVVVSYRVRAVPGGSRLVAVLRVGARAGVVDRARTYALAWGDLVMMRRQLLTLTALAEQADDAASHPAAASPTEP